MLLEIWLLLFLGALVFSLISFAYDSWIVCFCSLIFWAGLGFSGIIEIGTVPYNIVTLINYSNITPLTYLCFAFALIQGCRGLIIILTPNKVFIDDSGEKWEATG